MSMIASYRSSFIGAHVTPEVKQALEERATKEGKSVSWYIYSLLKNTLKVEDDLKEESNS